MIFLVAASFPGAATRYNKSTMPQLLKTLLNRTYEVQTPESCTVTNAAGNIILTAYPGTPVQFVADGKEVTLSADAAILRLAEGKSTVSAGGTGGTGTGTGTGTGGGSTTGETMENLSSAALQVKHATWFQNATQSAITVQPSPWKNKVMTCYLKTEIPVALSGVQWLYGEPAMMQGFSFVVALQQIDASTILANLAYTLKQ